MYLENIRDYCLGKTDTEETFPFGPDTLVYKVNGKVYLLAGIDSTPARFNAKCDPDRALELREQYDAVQPGYHMNKKHWNTIILDGSIPDKLIYELIDHSYNLVNPVKKKK